MSLLVVSDRRTESALLAARLRMRGLPMDGNAPRVVLVAKRELEPVEQEIILRVRERGGVVLQLERNGDAPIQSALQVSVPAGLDDVAGLAELAWLQALHSTQVWRVELERMPPQRLLKALLSARDAFVIEATLEGRPVRIEIDRGMVRRASYGPLKDVLAVRAFERHQSGTVQIRLTDASIKEPLADSNAGTPMSFFAPPKVEFERPKVIVEPPPPPPVVVREEQVDRLPLQPPPPPPDALPPPPPADAFEEEEVFRSQLPLRKIAIAAAALLVLVLAGRALFSGEDAAPVVKEEIAVIGPPYVPGPVEDDEPLELPPLSAERTLRLETTLLQARSLLAQGKGTEATALFAGVVMEGKALPQYQLALARLHMDAGQLDAAITVTERLIKLYPQFSEPYLLMGTVLQLQGADWARSKPLYERYLELSPNGAHSKDVRAIISRH